MSTEQSSSCTGSSSSEPRTRPITGSSYFHALPLHNRELFQHEDYARRIRQLSYEDGFEVVPGLNTATFLGDMADRFYKAETSLWPRSAVEDERGALEYLAVLEDVAPSSAPPSNLSSAVTRKPAIAAAMDERMRTGLPRNQARRGVVLADQIMGFLILDMLIFCASSQPDYSRKSVPEPVVEHARALFPHCKPTPAIHAVVKNIEPWPKIISSMRLASPNVQPSYYYENPMHAVHDSDGRPPIPRFLYRPVMDSASGSQSAPETAAAEDKQIPQANYRQVSPTYETEEASPGLLVSSRSQPPDPPTYSEILLLRTISDLSSLQRTEQTIVVEKTRLNLSAACFVLNWFKQHIRLGDLDYIKGQLIGSGELLNLGGQNLQDEIHKIWLPSKSDLGKPMLLGLFFSPIVLLGSSQLTTRQFDRWSCLAMPMLAKPKPRAILQVERMLWRCLLGISNGCDVLQTMMKFREDTKGICSEVNNMQDGAIEKSYFGGMKAVLEKPPPVLSSEDLQRLIPRSASLQLPGPPAKQRQMMSTDQLGGVLPAYTPDTNASLKALFGYTNAMAASGKIKPIFTVFNKPPPAISLLQTTENKEGPGMLCPSQISTQSTMLSDSTRRDLSISQDDPISKDTSSLAVQASERAPTSVLRFSNQLVAPIQTSPQSSRERAASIDETYTDLLISSSTSLPYIASGSSSTNSSILGSNALPLPLASTSPFVKIPSKILTQDDTASGAVNSDDAEVIVEEGDADMVAPLRLPHLGPTRLNLTVEGSTAPLPVECSPTGDSVSTPSALSATGFGSPETDVAMLGRSSLPTSPSTSTSPRFERPIPLDHVASPTTPSPSQLPVIQRPQLCISGTRIPSTPPCNPDSTLDVENLLSDRLPTSCEQSSAASIGASKAFSRSPVSATIASSTPSRNVYTTRGASDTAGDSAFSFPAGTVREETVDMPASTSGNSFSSSPSSDLLYRRLPNIHRSYEEARPNRFPVEARGTAAPEDSPVLTGPHSPLQLTNPLAESGSLPSLLSVDVVKACTNLSQLGFVDGQSADNILSPLTPTASSRPPSRSGTQSGSPYASPSAPLLSAKHQPQEINRGAMEAHSSSKNGRVSTQVKCKSRSVQHTSKPCSAAKQSQRLHSLASPKAPHCGRHGRGTVEKKALHTKQPGCESSQEAANSIDGDKEDLAPGRCFTNSASVISLPPPSHLPPRLLDTTPFHLPRLDPSLSYPLQGETVKLTFYKPTSLSPLQNRDQILPGHVVVDHQFENPILDEVQSVASLMRAVESYYIDAFDTRLPRHLQPSARSHVISVDDPNRSAIFVVNHEDFLKMRGSEIRGIHKDRHILVIDAPASDISFDASGLSKLGALSHERTIHDLGLRVGKSPTEALRRGSLVDLLSIAKAQPDRVMNMLDFPMPFMDTTGFDQCSEICLDKRAWNMAFGRPYFGVEPIPTSHLSWGLAATRNASSYTHIDACGFATAIQPLCGSKAWFVGVPKIGHELRGLQAFADWEADEANTDWLEYEPVFLDPTTRFYMKPGTPHYVITLDNCIFQGIHYYSPDGLCESIYAIYHCFALDETLTNTAHTGVDNKILSRIMVTWVGNCLPGMESPINLVANTLDAVDIHNPSWVLACVSLAAYLELALTIDRRCYEAVVEESENRNATGARAFDVLYVPESERHQVLAAREGFDVLSRALNARFSICLADKVVSLSDLALMARLHHAACLLLYLEWVEENNPQNCGVQSAVYLEEILDSLSTQDGQNVGLFRTKLEELCMMEFRDLRFDGWLSCTELSNIVVSPAPSPQENDPNLPLSGDEPVTLPRPYVGTAPVRNHKRKTNELERSQRGGRRIKRRRKN